MNKKDANTATFNSILFRWHKNNFRSMPWRETHDPYRILVSEIMLQQTRVSRVRQKYKPFLLAFPNVRALADAPLSDALRLWSGLGYNRRAKYLHQCAKMVMRVYGGKFPKDFDALMKLPGIGRSTAAALIAFAFGGDTPMIDTNVRRILVRCFFQKKSSPHNKNKHEIPSDRELFEFALMLIPKGKGREWNYAMLDLGATLCLARNHSSECPLIPLHGNVDDFIYKKPATKFIGSRRFYRGAALRILINRTSLTPLQFAHTTGYSPVLARGILEDLCAESLITKSGRSYRIKKQVGSI